MELLVYDGSFDGFLSAVFDVYDYKFTNVSFTPEANYQKNIFDQSHIVATSEEKAGRVWKGLEQRLSAEALNQLYKTFLSEIKDIESVLLAYIQYAFRSKVSIEFDYSNAAVLTVTQTAK